MEASEQSVTDYFLYVKNVLGVQTLHSSSIKSIVGEALANPTQIQQTNSQALQDQAAVKPTQERIHAAGPAPVEAARAAPTAPVTENFTAEADLLFLNIKTSDDSTVFDGEAKALADKMIQAMRLGNRKVLRRDVDLGAFKGSEIDAVSILQQHANTVKTPFVVIFSSKPGEQGVLRNLGTKKYLETFGPNYLMNHPQAKKVAWLDLQKVMKELGIS